MRLPVGASLDLPARGEEGGEVARGEEGAVRASGMDRPERSFRAAPSEMLRVMGCPGTFPEAMLWHVPLRVEGLQKKLVGDAQAPVGGEVGCSPGTIYLYLTLPLESYPQRDSSFCAK